VTRRLSFTVTPGDLAGKIDIEADGSAVEGESLSLELPEGDDKRVVITARAEGYRPFRKVVRVSEDMSVPVSMRKIVKRSGGHGKRHRGKKKGSGPGGLIDL
jgi:hypothetical protein